MARSTNGCRLHNTVYHSVIGHHYVNLRQCSRPRCRDILCRDRDESEIFNNLLEIEMRRRHVSRLRHQDRDYNPEQCHPVLGIIQNLMLRVRNTNYLTAYFTMIYENILSVLVYSTQLDDYRHR